MPAPSAATNLTTYDAAEIVSYYASLEYLTPCEKLLFDSFVGPGSAVLDLGVGGGRTTRYLAAGASLYIGVDYAPSMVKVCQRKFPKLEFKIADAADLSAFENESFDAVVFAFNGIDYVSSAEARRRCCRHIHRVLKPKGCLIFSSHNPRAILVRPRWNRERLRQIARTYSSGSAIKYEFLMAGLMGARFAVAFAQSIWATLLRVFGRVPSRAFWRGEGDLIDPSHGGLFTHHWIPARLVEEMNASNFLIERVLGDDYPQASHHFATDWYYYVFSKR